MKKIAAPGRRGSNVIKAFQGDELVDEVDLSSAAKSAASSEASAVSAKSEQDRIEKERAAAEDEKRVRLQQEEEDRRVAQQQLEEQQRAAREQEVLRQQQDAARIAREQEEIVRLEAEKKAEADEQDREAADLAASLAERARLAKIAKAEAEEEELRAFRLAAEEQRRKREMFLMDTDAFSAQLGESLAEKEARLKAAKEAGAEKLADDLRKTSQQFVAPQAKLVEQPAAPLPTAAPPVPVSETVDEMSPPPVPAKTEKSTSSASVIHYTYKTIYFTLNCVSNVIKYFR